MLLEKATAPPPLGSGPDLLLAVSTACLVVTWLPVYWSRDVCKNWVHRLPGPRPSGSLTQLYIYVYTFLMKFQNYVGKIDKNVICWRLFWMKHSVQQFIFVYFVKEWDKTLHIFYNTGRLLGSGTYLISYMNSERVQSDWNSFGGDVVLNSVNMAYWNEDSILDSIYQILNFTSDWIKSDL